MVVFAGRGFFGQGAWGRRVFWQNVPVQHRQLDINGYLEDLLQTWGDEFEEMLQLIQYLPNQREPYEVRAQEGLGEEFYVSETIVEAGTDFGDVVRLVGEKNSVNMPSGYEAATETGPEWTIKIADTEYKVVNVRLRNFDPVALYDANNSLANEIWVQSVDDILIAPVDYQIGTGDGTATPAIDNFPFPSTTTTPVGLWENDTDSPPPWLISRARVEVLVDLSVSGETRLYDVPDAPSGVGTGSLYPEDSGNPGEIDTATSYGEVDYTQAQISLDLTASGETAVDGKPILGTWHVKCEFFPPRLIDYLARDFGFENDQNDPEFVQRSLIANITKYFGLKSTQDSYRIRGEISLFDTFARGLWLVCDAAVWAALPPDHKFTYDGDLYTDLEPRYLHFDDISGDAVFYDPDTSAWVYLTDDNALMHEDSSADGMSVALAFSLDVTQGYYGQVSEVPPDATSRDPATITSVTALTAADLVTYGLAAGYRVVVEMYEYQKDEFNFTNPGIFGLTEYDKTGGVPPALDDFVWWIDAEESWQITTPGPPYDIGEWTIIIGTGVGASGPTNGSDVAVKYWPQVETADCCFCRSYKMRVEAEPTADAYSYYTTPDALNRAIWRLEGKFLDTIVPIHARVVEYVAKFQRTLSNVEAGATVDYDFVWDEFEESASLGPVTKVIMTIEQRGDLDTGAKTMDFELYDENSVKVWDATGKNTGYSDPITWFQVDGAIAVDVTSYIANNSTVRIRGIATAGVVYGDQRWTFYVTR